MSNRQDEQVRINCKAILKESLKAVLIEVDADEYDRPQGELNEIWLPRSQIHSICEDAHDCHVYVTPWIAKQKGLL